MENLEKLGVTAESAKDLTAAVEGLEKALDKSGEVEKLAEKTAMKVFDIYLPYNHMFSEATKRGMDRQVTDLMPSRTLKFVDTLNKTVFDRVEYFGAIAIGEKVIYDAAKRVVQTLNNLASKGFITGSLVKLSMVQLVSEPFELEKYAIFSYVAINEAGQKFLEEDRPGTMFNGEGGLPDCTVRDHTL